MKAAAKFEAIIGLEVHAQLKTASKMFCSCSTVFGAEPNSNICPICTAQPGTLPVVNQEAINMAIRTGLALGSTIQTSSVFARKNYFYPDLPKGYQISQYELPLCLGGRLGKVSIVRVHLEEDAGKLLHDMGDGSATHIDFNRCGVPLIEIVSGPDMRTPGEAGDYLRMLRNVLVYLDVCDGNMQEGSFRCDANISVRRKGETKFGTRTELKNLNSFKAVERAIAYEIKRQTEVIRFGGEVVQETLLWCEATQRTEPMRSKEEAQDYRYFPDPDLLPLIVDTDLIGKLGNELPELSFDKARRFVGEYGLSEYDADQLVEDKSIADYFEKAVKAYDSPKKIANWIMTELMRELKSGDLCVSECPISPENMAKLVSLIDEGTVSGRMAKEVFSEMYSTGEDPEGIVGKKGMKLESDQGVLQKLVDEVIAANPQQVKKYREGKKQLMGFFVGEVMKATRGQADPKLVNELIRKKLD